MLFIHNFSFHGNIMQFQFIFKNSTVRNFIDGQIMIVLYRRPLIGDFKSASDTIIIIIIYDFARPSLNFNINLKHKNSKCFKRIKKLIKIKRKLVPPTSSMTQRRNFRKLQFYFFFFNWASAL